MGKILNVVRLVVEYGLLNYRVLCTEEQNMKEGKIISDLLDNLGRLLAGMAAVQLMRNYLQQRVPTGAIIDYKVEWPTNIGSADAEITCFIKPKMAIGKIILKIDCINAE